MVFAYKGYLVSVDLHGIHNNKVKLTSQFSLKDPFCESCREVDIHNIFHCDGLLLYTTMDNRLVVWNEAKGKYES
ncbi:unnamed protein product [Arabidopsis lyrata]|uniref:F-box associated beta-propeller type 1 domain-containing protein n=1 Tax=Arabidopsis lyrata subsp. lyrata TaxID=81972 RepID=D7LY28_ARALL|nr:hypothetical protein ARALYDRAFT_911314 [Arabidopsis lyrata subsp. lyrata]CAH8272813.1 unnamed protein product [Arabidopsis lyrata]